MELAVIKTGGKQYVVAKGDVVTIEKLPAKVAGGGSPDAASRGELKKGDSVTFSEVLMTDDGSTVNVGTPTVKGASVKGTVASVGRHKKIDVVKYKAKSRYLKRRGHKQPYIKVKIDTVG